MKRERRRLRGPTQHGRNVVDWDGPQQEREIRSRETLIEEWRM